MMEYEYGGIRHRIRFQHLHAPDEKRKERCIPIQSGHVGLIRAMTTCFIDIWQPEVPGGPPFSPARWCEGVSGRAWCQLPDNFSRERGRRLALARAVMVFTPGERKRAWEAYLNRPRPRLLEHEERDDV